jgi:hypothetical protein
MPNMPMPTVWTSVAMPQANRSALIRIAICSLGQMQRAAQDQRHRDRVRIHDKHMLQAERGQSWQRQNLIDAIGRAVHRTPPNDERISSGKGNNGMRKAWFTCPKLRLYC